MMAATAPMPPGASNEAVAHPIFGKFSSPATFGIIGMPRVGKSTLFSAMAEVPLPAENTETVEVKKAYMAVQNPDLDWISEVYNSQNKISALLQVMDTPGLVRGARFGLGHGNHFLEELKECDAILHILRGFHNENISHVDGTLNPVRDLECVNQELISKDSQFLSARIDKLQNLMKKRRLKKLDFELSLCVKVLDHLRNGIDVRVGKWTNDEIHILETYHLLTAKPVIYLLNLSEQDFRGRNKSYLSKVHDWVKENGHECVVPFSCQLFHTPDDQLTARMIPRIISLGFGLCHITNFFTADAFEAKCWHIRIGTKAHDVARAIGGSFISVKVMKLKDMREYGSEDAVQAAGRHIEKAMTYTVHDGDIIKFES